MIVHAWRIVKRKYAKHAFTGEGARRFGGRWNGRGTAVVYCASSRALAALELLVHLESEDLLSTYLLFEVALEESLIAEASSLPPQWHRNPPPSAVSSVGDQWAKGGRSVALRVPSVVVPDEHNLLLNPEHPDFGRLQIGRPQVFRFDRRLAK